MLEYKMLARSVTVLVYNQQTGPDIVSSVIAQ